eukprot:TRINITY_DN12257_c4_g2_i2.p1 TRINITY_DN12257_c4_g2~~TRINITY_DN12257_c4_g2_i2.p1  ORF type:complete len:1556 (+),score=459.06 TRINITY_DN12257_c4_g2_i2:362-5029(+)
MAMAGVRYPDPSTLRAPDDVDDPNSSDIAIGHLASLGGQPHYTKKTTRKQVGPTGAIDRNAWQSTWLRISETPEEVESHLQGLRDGNFAVRRDLLNANDLVLYYVYGGEVCSEQLLPLTDGGVQLEHGSIKFRDLSHLVDYHTTRKGDLPVQLTVKAAPFIPEEGNAGEGEPLRVNDVCAWLESVGLGQYKEEFNRLCVDGAALAAMNEEQLTHRFNMPKHDQAVFFRERDVLDKSSFTLDARHTKARRVQLVIKDVDGRKRAFDARTGEDVTHNEFIINSVREWDPELADLLCESARDDNDNDSNSDRASSGHNPPPKQQERSFKPVAPQATRAEFEWQGIAQGWVRHAHGRRVVQDEFGIGDVGAWAKFMGYDDKVVMALRQEQIDGPTLAGMERQTLRNVGGRYGVGDKLVRAGAAFQHGTSPDSHRHATMDSFVDTFAERASWYKVDEPFDKAIEDIQSPDAPNHAFVVVREPDQLLSLQVLQHGSGAIAPMPLEVVDGGRGIRIQGREFVASDLSELVQYYGAYNEEEGWLLDPEATEDSLRSMPWYKDREPTGSELNDLRNAPEGAFILHPVDDGSPDHSLKINHGGRITNFRIIESENGVRLATTQEYLFYNLQHLIDYYSFVRHNHLGLTLYRDADTEPLVDELGDTSIDLHPPTAIPARRWFISDIDRQGAETILRNAPDGTFLVRRSSDPSAPYCLSYVCDGHVYHMLIEEDHQGVSFRDAPEAFISMDDLIEHHQKQEQTVLVCPLAGPASVPNSLGDLREKESNVQTVPVDYVDGLPASNVEAVPVQPRSRVSFAQSSESQSRAAPQSNQGKSRPYGVLGQGNYPWLKLDPFTKSQALGTLQGKDEGAFVVRSSDRFPECMVLSYVHNNQVHHELIGADVDESDNAIGLHLIKQDHIIYQDIEELVDAHKTNKTVLQTLLKDPSTTTTTTTTAASGARNVSFVDPAPSNDRGFSQATTTGLNVLRQSSRATTTGSGMPRHTSQATTTTIATNTYLRETAPWLITGMPADDALSLLKGKPDGSFIIRESPETTDVLILCYLYDNSIYQKYISMDEAGVHLDINPNQRFLTLHELVQYYATKRDELHTALRVHDGQIAFQEQSSSRALLPTREANMTQAQQTSLSPEEEHLTRASQHERSLAILQQSDVLRADDQFFYVGQSDGQTERLEPVQSQRTFRPPSNKQRALPPPRRATTSGASRRASKVESSAQTETRSRRGSKHRSTSSPLLRKESRASRSERRSSAAVPRRRYRDGHLALAGPMLTGNDLTLRRRRKTDKDDKKKKQTKETKETKETQTKEKTRGIKGKDDNEDKNVKAKADKAKAQADKAKAQADKAKAQADKAAKAAEKARIKAEKKKKGTKGKENTPAHEEDDTVPVATSTPMQQQPVDISDPAQNDSRRGTDPLPAVPPQVPAGNAYAEGNVDDARTPMDPLEAVRNSKQRWKHVGMQYDQVQQWIGPEDGSFIVHSPDTARRDRVFAALSFRRNGNIVTRDILDDDQYLKLQGSSASFSSLDVLIAHYVEQERGDLNVQLRLESDYGAVNN